MSAKAHAITIQTPMLPGDIVKLIAPIAHKSADPIVDLPLILFIKKTIINIKTSW